jgi:hypothetical protein
MYFPLHSVNPADESPDPQCVSYFGPGQVDMQHLRSQSLDSLGGKLIRIDAMTGTKY